MEMFVGKSEMFSKLFRPWDAAAELEKSNQIKKHFKEENSPIKINKSGIEDSFKKPSERFDDVQAKSEHDKIVLKSEQRSRKSCNDRGNKLRKIRNQWKNGLGDSDQDCTISTTTSDVSSIVHCLKVEDSNGVLKNDDKRQEEINERLCIADLNNCVKNKLKNDKNYEQVNQKCNKSDVKKDFLLQNKEPAFFKNNQTINQCYPVMSSPYSLEALSHHHHHQGRYPAEILSQADLVQSLGIPPTDPMLLESFAQGYAMELEYARILHEENQAKLLNARKQRPKKYRCPHCDVGFSNNGQLKGHIRIHTGERPYKCDDKACGKTFTRNEELTRHRRIHSGLRPYPCQTCGKKFGRRDHLKKHTRTHIVQAERMMPMFVPLAAMGHVPGYPYLYGY